MEQKVPLVQEKKSDTWLTPPDLIRKLGKFDLDPCCPAKMPWQTARYHYTIKDDGLSRQWIGRVWCNPPYSNVRPWLEKCCVSGNAIALTFAKTDTKWFHEIVFTRADAILFISGRLKFHDTQGTQSGSAPHPSVLIAFGETNASTLRTCEIKGHFVDLKQKGERDKDFFS